MAPSEYSVVPASHSSDIDRRRGPEASRPATVTAFFRPAGTTPRVTPSGVADTPRTPLSTPLGFKSQLLRLEIRPRRLTATRSISTCPRLDRTGGGRATQEKTSNKKDTLSPPSPIARHRRAAIAKHRRRDRLAERNKPPGEGPRRPEIPPLFPQMGRLGIPSRMSRNFIHDRDDFGPSRLPGDPPPVLLP